MTIQEFNNAKKQPCLLKDSLYKKHSAFLQALGGCIIKIQGAIEKMKNLLKRLMKLLKIRRMKNL